MSLLVAVVAVSFAFGDAVKGRMLLPIEVLGANGTTVSTTFPLQAEQAASVRFLWLQIHRLRYAGEASIQVNNGVWMPLNNSTVTIAEPGRSFGGIGGGFATLTMTVPLPKEELSEGTNTIRFRFNQTDGFASGYRVLAWNFLDGEGSKILPPDDFAEDAPENWTPPLPDTASILAGRELWHTASLVASSLPDSPRIQAHCADCHAQDGRDLKYFNFSNYSIVSRSCFHGLSTRQGEQIASYIRSLPLPNPGRPWNPPYQPGPGVDAKPVSHWAAGAGLAWVLNQDIDALPYLIKGDRTNEVDSHPPEYSPNIHAFVGEITPDMFRPDGNLNPRQVPIALQLPDWNQWLPRVHPKDAWGAAFTESEFAALYSGQRTADGQKKVGAKPPLRTFLAGIPPTNHNISPVVDAFAHWSQTRHAFLKHSVKANAVWSSVFTDKVYSTQLWQLVKTWEMTQEFALEGRGRDLYGLIADSRTWCNTVPADTAPAATRIPDGPTGVGGSALTNEYATAAWYELQIILNSGNHQHRGRSPVDWVYLIGQFRDLYSQTKTPDPARLLVAVTKSLQSTNPHIGPRDLTQGWRPDENIDPRIMISPLWAPILKPLPTDLHRALTTSLLAAWLDKNLQYPISDHLPFGLLGHSYLPARTYGDISGGRVWDSAEQFRHAGVSNDLVERLQEWGVAYNDRAARLQY